MAIFQGSRVAAFEIQNIPPGVGENLLCQFLWSQGIPSSNLSSTRQKADGPSAISFQVAAEYVGRVEALHEKIWDTYVLIVKRLGASGMQERACALSAQQLLQTSNTGQVLNFLGAATFMQQLDQLLEQQLHKELAKAYVDAIENKARLDTSITILGEGTPSASGMHQQTRLHEQMNHLNGKPPGNWSFEGPAAAPPIHSRACHYGKLPSSDWKWRGALEQARGRDTVSSSSKCAEPEGTPSASGMHQQTGHDEQMNHLNGKPPGNWSFGGPVAAPPIHSRACHYSKLPSSGWKWHGALEQAQGKDSVNSSSKSAESQTVRELFLLEQLLQSPRPDHREEEQVEHLPEVQAMAQPLATDVGNSFEILKSLLAADCEGVQNAKDLHTSSKAPEGSHRSPLVPGLQQSPRAPGLQSLSG